jgi:hypothetical protein
MGLLSLLGAAACSSDNAGPQLPPCTAAGFAVTLAAAGQYASVDPGPAAGCLVFPANSSGSPVEYLIVPQLATGVPAATSSFQLLGDTIRPAKPSAPAPAPAPSSAGDLTMLPPAERFHTFLRLGDETRWRGLNPQVAPRGATPARTPAVAAGPPAFGSSRTFKVCARLNCSTFATVTATVRALKSNVAIYVDTTAPPGLDSLALDTLATTFETKLYATDTAAFGRESDIDTNSVVMILMTPTVNKLVTSTQCAATGFVAGFFFGADLDPAFRTDSRSNKGEVFYSLVADPSGTFSCAHSASQVQRLVPVTFIHEFQHMISYNQHVLVRGGDGEALWLNEGFSHYAEELGGRTLLPNPGATVSNCTIGTPPCAFMGGDLFNGYSYLDSTDKHFLLPSAGIGSLAERGAAWMFVRYLVDRYSGGTTMTLWNAFTRQLLQTSLTGAENIAAHTGASFEGIVTRWALTNWVSDLPGFTPDTALRYTSWSFRAAYSSLHTQNQGVFPKIFPLTPTTSAGSGVSLRGVLRAGSGVYHRIVQAPGEAGFTLLFSTAEFTPLFDTEGRGAIPASLVPRLNVIRIR